MKRIMLVLIVMLAVPATSWAYTMDLDFSTDPAGLGWTANGQAATWLSTAAGEWQVIAASDKNGYYKHTAVTPGLANSTHNVQAEIDVTTFAGFGNVGICSAGSTSLDITLSGYIVNGGIMISGGKQLDGTNGFSATIPVANQDGLMHTYALDIDTTVAGVVPVRFFFDGAQVGDVGGYDAYSPFTAADPNPNESWWFGDGSKSGGAHQEVWDSYVIQPGLIPEPATMGVLAIAGVLALLSRKKK